jgi:hypothetical protein
LSEIDLTLDQKLYERTNKFDLHVIEKATWFDQKIEDALPSMRSDLMDVQNRLLETENQLSGIRLRDIKFFTAVASNDTTYKDTTISLQFPERVDHIAIDSLLNDGHDMHVLDATKLDERS